MGISFRVYFVLEVEFCLELVYYTCFQRYINHISIGKTSNDISYFLPYYILKKLPKIVNSFSFGRILNKQTYYQMVTSITLLPKACYWSDSFSCTLLKNWFIVFVTRNSRVSIIMKMTFLKKNVRCRRNVDLQFIGKYLNECLTVFAILLKVLNPLSFNFIWINKLGHSQFTYLLVCIVMSKLKKKKTRKIKITN